MPKKENYINPNPFSTPEPHMKPGYAGYLPGFGPRRHSLPPKVYEVNTYEIMAPHPIAGLRMGYILEIPKEDLKVKQEEDYYMQQHQTLTEDLKRTENMVCGYTGHIPRNKTNIGMPFPKAVKKATANFIKIRSSDVH